MLCISLISEVTTLEVKSLSSRQAPRMVQDGRELVQAHCKPWEALSRSRISSRFSASNPFSVPRKSGTLYGLFVQHQCCSVLWDLADFP